MAAPVFLHFITTSSSLVLAGTLLEAMRRGKSQRGEAGQTCVSTQIAYGHAESTQRRHNYSRVNFLHICLVEVERYEHWCCLLIRSLQETRDSLWHVVSSFIISVYLAGIKKKTFLEESAAQMKLQILDVLCSKNRVEPGMLMKQLKGDQQIKVVRKACWSHVHRSEEEKSGAFHNQERFTSHPPFSSSENTQHFIIDLSGPLLFSQSLLSLSVSVNICQRGLSPSVFGW